MCAREIAGLWIVCARAFERVNRITHRLSKHNALLRPRSTCNLQHTRSLCSCRLRAQMREREREREFAIQVYSYAQTLINNKGSRET